MKPEIFVFESDMYWHPVKIFAFDLFEATHLYARIRRRLEEGCGYDMAWPSEWEEYVGI